MAMTSPDASSTAALTQPILQFGTSRFLQAHVDLFVSDALARGDADAIGGITVVQTTDNPDSTARVAALSSGAGYPVKIRGIQNGQVIDTTQHCHAIREAAQATRDWARIRDAFCGPVRIVISNTADRGFLLDNRDDIAIVDDPGRVPHSFPAKLLVLLYARWQRLPDAPLSIFPCELIENNGDALRDVVTGLARTWHMPEDFVAYLDAQCVWVNSLVDRIVPEPLHPAGAIAEPYALWAVERRPRMLMPCSHPSIVLTDDAEHYERLKLFLLNLGHTYLAERWLRDRRAPDETVLDAMNDAVLRAELEALWRDEVLPVFDALGKHDDAVAYLSTLRERFMNPLLVHKLADIARNHEPKKQRRFAPVVALAKTLGLAIEQPRLTMALADATVAS